MKNYFQRPQWIGFVAVVVLNLLGGCCTSKPAVVERVVQRQEEAGSTHVSILSVARWQAYSSALQPTFKMTAEDALAQAVPSTLQLDERILDAVKAGLQIAPPGSSLTETSTLSKIAGFPTTQSLTRIEKTEPGDVTKATFGDSPAKDQDLSKLGPKDSILNTNPNLDPMLRHLVATALYQEVQMLNRYVRDAAVGDREPYVVRLQVSVLPRARNLPYDVYSTISFFLGDFECPIDAPTHLQRPEATRLGLEELEAIQRQSFTKEKTEAVPTLFRSAATTQPAMKLSARDALQEVASWAKSDPTRQKVARQMTLEIIAAACRQHAGKESAPEIIPLLVTDSIEAALHSRTTDQVRQLAFALGAMLQGVGAKADLQKVQQEIQSALGRDFNSTFTVARASDNTLRTRFGAVQGPSGYSIVPQTHTVTLLVLLPKDRDKTDNTIHYVSRSDFIHVRTGDQLLSRTQQDLQQIAAKIMTDFGIPFTQFAGPLDVLALEVLKYTDRNDFSGFKAFLNDHNIQIHDLAESLWLEIANSRTGGHLATGHFRLPRAYAPEVPPIQSPIVIDNGETSSQATLVGARDIAIEELSGFLQVGNYRIPATSIIVSEDSSRVQVSFPSLKVLALDQAAAQAKGCMMNLVLNRAAQPSTYEGIYKLIVEKPSPPKSKATIVTSSRVVRATDGAGTVIVSVNVSPATALFLKVEGADVRGATLGADSGTTVTPEVGRWKVSRPANIGLSLGNLDPSTQVVVSVTADGEPENAVASKVTFNVVQPSPPPKQ